VPIFATALVLLSMSAAPEVKVTTENYKGWPGSMRISNGRVDLVVVPQIGRVMRYGFVDGPNLLWENQAFLGKSRPGNQWVNYGGDKIWPAPQSVWNWPPDADLDGSAYKAEAIRNGVRLTSPLSRKMKLQFTREITLDPLTTQVNFRNRMENRGERRLLGLWQVTQIDDPTSITMGTAISSTQPKGWYGFGNERMNPAFHEQRGQSLVIRRDPQNSRKFGARSSSGEITATKGSILFRTHARVVPGVEYPDRGSAQQVYTNADPDRYAEMEHAGPLSRMDRFESVFQNVVWSLKQGV